MSLEIRYTGGSGNGVPPGPQIATLEALETKEVTYDGRTSKRLLWKMIVAMGKSRGEVVYGFTGSTLGANTKLLKFVNGVLGRNLQLGESIDLNSLVGKDFWILVEKSPKSDSTQVVSISPAPTAP